MGHQGHIPVILIQPLVSINKMMFIVGEDLTDEDRYEMQSLFDRLKYVEERQSKLKGAVDADLRRVRSVSMCHYASALSEQIFNRLTQILLPSAEDGAEAKA